MVEGRWWIALRLGRINLALKSCTDLGSYKRVTFKPQPTLVYNTGGGAATYHD